MAFTKPMLRSHSNGPNRPTTKWDEKPSISASKKTRRSPRLSVSAVAIAAPFPDCEPAGIATGMTVAPAPAPAATAAVASMERSFATMISSTR